MATKKRAKPAVKRGTIKKAAPSKSPVAESQEMADGQFVLEMFKQTEASLARVADPERQAAIGARLKAMRTKFKSLPKTKVTRERAERYAAEIQKIGVEIQSAARD